MSKRFVFAGGGTGGHIFPLVAVAQAVRAASPDVEIVYVGTERGMEKRVLGDLGEKLELLHILPIKGGGVTGAIKGAARALMSLPDSRNLLRRLEPAAVLSIGGYAAGPVSLAARSMRIPLALLEPNSVVGLANKLVAPFAQRAYVAFPETEKLFRRKIVRLTGVPLRRGFKPIACEPQDGLLRILVIGGSQGAITLNHNVPAAIGMARRQGKVRIQVKHQSGRDREKEVIDRYEQAGARDEVEVVPFIDDVPAALGQADVVVQRAGASAVSEVCAVGRASVLIPYPYAAGDHQLHNARAMEAAGASVCVASQEATPERLAAILQELAADLPRCKRMAEVARGRGRPDAADAIAKDFLSLAGVA
ncbi:MAG: undecaprenyldiphospho-muramoylpentapeptide beta-N-acetylglucosaminyltransferase [Deltaproteobacteria bacterium]|nr:undecaprenyldiphospho-muramoylpentapeptide beta-N-acetylglucosaminyltransferase [Deltaproteobacteria bacterium]